MRLAQKALALLVSGALALGATAALAQQGRGFRRGGMIPAPPYLLAKLKLNDDQSKKLMTAAETFRSDMQAARNSQGDDRRAASMKARETYQNTLNETLNDDQKKQWQAWVEEERGYRDLGPLGIRLVGLDLSDEQKAKVKEIAANHQADRDAVRAKFQSGDRDGARQAAQDLNTKITDEVKAVLKPEQLTEFNNRAPRGQRNGGNAA